MRSEQCVILTGGAPRLQHDPVSSDVARYDHVTKKWIRVTEIPAPRHHHAGTVA